MSSPDVGLGFSLRPPKWLRKAQPGRILKKAAIPLAIIGGTLLIPGVGGAVVGGLTAAGKAVGGFAARSFKSIRRVGSTVNTTVNTIMPAPSVSTYSTPAPMISTLPGPAPSVSTFSMPAPVPTEGGSFMPAQPVASDQATGSSAPSELPGWVIPAGIAAVALVFMSGRRR
jgi:hypothetical protein